LKLDVKFLLDIFVRVVYISTSRGWQLLITLLSSLQNIVLINTWCD